jgi:serine/threonine protein kinase
MTCSSVKLFFLSFCLPYFHAHRCDEFQEFSLDLRKFWENPKRQDLNDLEFIFPKYDWDPPGSILGKGSFGLIQSTFLKSDPSTSVALKTIDISDELKKREPISFLTEIQMLCEFLGNNHFLQIIDFGMISPTKLTITTEKADGDVFSLMKNYKLNVALRFEFIDSLILMIEELHSHDYIYRDLKLNNLLYFRNKSTNRISIKLGDFGLSSRCPLVTDCVGNYETVPPELFTPSDDFEFNGKPGDVFGVSMLMSDILEIRFPLFPRMENMDLNKRPTIEVVKEKFFEYKRLHQLMRIYGKTNIAQIKEHLTLDEKILIIDSVISQLQDLHESGYAYQQLRWENVLYIKDEDRVTVMLENFGFVRIFENYKIFNNFKKTLTKSLKRSTLFYWRLPVKENQLQDILRLCSMLDSILETPIFFSYINTIQRQDSRSIYHVRAIFEKIKENTMKNRETFSFDNDILDVEQILKEKEANMINLNARNSFIRDYKN